MLEDIINLENKNKSSIAGFVGDVLNAHDVNNIKKEKNFI